MKGILFRQELIKAIVEGRKTVSRRAMKPQPHNEKGVMRWQPRKGIDINMEHLNPSLINSYAKYQVGEVVYLKETLFRHPYLNEAGYVLDETPVFINQTIGDCLKWRWSKDILPSMFMPQEAARYHIRIKGVRAERLELPLSPDELEREGGEAALPMLTLIDGKWVWRYSFEKASQ